MEIIKVFNKALQDLYDHVGFKEDWVIYPVDDRTEMYWKIVNLNEVKYADTMEKFNSDGEYYLNTIYTQRFYNKWIYRGKQLTMIFCDAGIDGMIYFAFFDNSKEVKKKEYKK